MKDLGPVWEAEGPPAPARHEPPQAPDGASPRRATIPVSSARFAALLAGEARGRRGRRRRRSGTSSPTSRPRRRGGDRLHPPLRRARADAAAPARRGSRDRRRGRRLRRPRRSPRWRSRRSGSKPTTGRRSRRTTLHRRARRQPRLALDGDRVGRALRAGRHRELSLLGADERRAGEGRGRAADRHGGADAARRARTRWCSPPPSSPASTRSTGSAARRRSRRSPTARRRSPPVAKIVGPGNAYVAAAKRRVFGAGRHRHDRRPVRGAGHRRRRAPTPTGSPPTCSPRPSTTPRRSRSSSPTAPALADAVEAARRAASSRPCRARDIAARELARFRRRSSWCRASPTRSRSSTASRPSISRSRPATPTRSPRKVRNAGAIFLGGHTPEAIGDYVGGPNHVLPTARSARFSSGLGGARLHEAHLDPQMRAAVPARARPRRDRARPRRGPRGSCPLGGAKAQSLGRAHGFTAIRPLSSTRARSGRGRWLLMPAIGAKAAAALGSPGK